MPDPDRPSDIEAPEIEPQDRFITPDQPEDDASRLASAEPDPALEEQPEDPPRAPAGPDPATDDEKRDQEVEQSFPASDPPAY